MASRTPSPYASISLPPRSIHKVDNGNFNLLPTRQLKACEAPEYPRKQIIKPKIPSQPLPEVLLLLAEHWSNDARRQIRAMHCNRSLIQVFQLNFNTWTPAHPWRIVSYSGPAGLSRLIKVFITRPKSTS